MKIQITERQLKYVFEDEEISPRVVRVVNNLVDSILSILVNEKQYRDNEHIELIEYSSDTIVVAFMGEVLTFEFNNSIEESPYYRPGTYEDPPEGSDGYWSFEPSTLKYEKSFGDEFITVYEGKDFTNFIKNIPDWLDYKIQEELRMRYDDDY